ncbi:TPM domain-containing protein [Leptospira sarikeiensis]|uniref:YgcG family protein n=1 Tax=Leptospira sarikeiensis TaxID=2484943 RepID=A0A4R9KGX6_9LEPT|nr:TPM domain-containing protein [Leptospira sarikeiensis]TGL64657.1 YgcG family protein [Leptospira sarikeiensis]
MKGLFFFSLLFFSFGIFGEQIQIPRLEHRVTDLTSTLSEEEVSSLEEKLKSFEKRKGSQVVLVVIPTTGEETIEQYSIRLADEWKIGRKGVGDGVIFLVAKEDRKMRFEIGRGLEGTIPDATSKRIQLEYIRPLFKEGKFYEGVDQGIDKILGLIDGEILPEPNSTSYEHSPDASDDSFGFFIGALVIIGIAVGILFKKLFSLLQAGLATYFGYLAGGFLGFSFELMLPLLVIFFILLCIIYISAKNPGSGGGSSGWSSGSTWSSYSSGSSDWSSSSSSDSFSGGGGDFGGGGSSSDW